jgi:hypothetical protein
MRGGFDGVGQADSFGGRGEDGGDAGLGVVGNVVVAPAGDPCEVGPLLEQDAVEPVAVEELGQPPLLGLDLPIGHTLVRLRLRLITDSPADCTGAAVP